jgi:hypothetical protein
MRRRAADNVYLHRDFHAALNRALLFLEDRYGADAVREYLTRFAAAHYAPLREAIGRRGLAALEDHLVSVFTREGGGAEIARNGDDLVVRVSRCPAVSHIREMGTALSPLFFETTRTVNEALCEGSPFRFSFDALDCAAGTCVQRFARRRP